MFIGHFAVGMAAKKFEPKLSLGVLFIGCQLLDFIWPVVTLLGLETVTHDHSLPTFNSLNLVHVPISHSLGMSLIWSFLFGLLIKKISGSLRAAWICGIVVFSHWILDFITHIPDLPLWFGMQKVGLGLWKSKIGTFVVESILFGAGVALYLNVKGSMPSKRRVIFLSMVAFLYLFFIGHVFGPKPPETQNPYVVAGPAFAMWLIVWWGWAADRPVSPQV